MYDFIFPGILLLLWVGVRVMLPAVNYDFDFDVAHGSFTMILEKYLFIVRGMVIADILLALLPSARLVSDMPVHCCLAGAVTGILFSVWTTAQYELYLHSRYPRCGGGQLGPSVYSASKRALTLALGWGTVIFTVVGMVAVLA